MHITFSPRQTYKIHPDCQETIEMINRYTDIKVKFLYLRKLREYYRDDFSELNKEVLMKLIHPTALKFIERQEGWGLTDKLEAMRWVGRGLPYKLAGTIVELHRMKRTR